MNEELTTLGKTRIEELVPLLLRRHVIGCKGFL
ncbi:hypothetical protein CsSME_00036578 [Camellia sinensis var. sinensis]